MLHLAVILVFNVMVNYQLNSIQPIGLNGHEEILYKMYINNNNAYLVSTTPLAQIIPCQLQQWFFLYFVFVNFLSTQKFFHKQFSFTTLFWNVHSENSSNSSPLRFTATIVYIHERFITDFFYLPSAICY